MKNNLADFKKKRICQCFECAAFLNNLEAELREMWKYSIADYDPDFFNLIKEILGE